MGSVGHLGRLATPLYLKTKKRNESLTVPTWSSLKCRAATAIWLSCLASVDNGGQKKNLRLFFKFFCFNLEAIVHFIGCTDRFNNADNIAYSIV